MELIEDEDEVFPYLVSQEPLPFKVLVKTESCLVDAKEIQNQDVDDSATSDDDVEYLGQGYTATKGTKRNLSFFYNTPK